MDHQVPSWLANAVSAAGMATVYNADDWVRLTDRAANTPEAANEEIPPTMN